MKQRKRWLTALMTLAVVVVMNLCLAGTAEARTNNSPVVSPTSLLIRPGEVVPLTVTISDDPTDTFNWFVNTDGQPSYAGIEIYKDQACTERVKSRDEECTPGTYFIKGVSEGVVKLSAERLNTEYHQTMTAPCTITVLNYTPIPADQSAAGGGLTYFVGVSSITGTYGSGNNENYTNLCNKSDSKWCIDFPSNEKLIFAEFNRTDAFIPKKVYLRTGDDNSKYNGRNPASWRLLAKNNPNDDWITLREVTNDKTMQDKDFKAYEFDLNNGSNTAYKYFRFEVSAVQSGNIFQLSELYLAGYRSSSDIPDTRAEQTITADDVTMYLGDTGVKVDAATSGDGALSYRVSSGDAVSVDAATGELTPLKEGTAAITITAAGTSRYQQASKTINVTVYKTRPEITPPEANDLAYNGLAQQLVTEGKVVGGTMQYAIGEDDTTPPEEGWSETVPTGTEAGTYPVWYKVTGDAAHADLAPMCVPVIIRATGQPNIYLRAHVQNQGWDEKLTELRAGQSETIGTTGLSRRLEAIDLIVPENQTVTGFAHVQNIGDTEVTKVDKPEYAVPEGYAVYRFGTTGRSLRMEALRFGIADADGEMIKGLEYATHVQNYGWQGYAQNGSFAGTRGMSLRMEALRFSYTARNQDIAPKAEPTQ